LEEEFIPNYLADHVYAFLYVKQHCHRPYDIVDANAIHRRLMINSNLPSTAIGTFRRVQVFVGNNIPPRAEVLHYNMDDWQIAAKELTSNPWENHKLFEHIHPYLDGNGRTGRLLWAWDMLRRGESVREILPMFRVEGIFMPERTPELVRMAQKKAYYLALDNNSNEPIHSEVKAEDTIQAEQARIQQDLY